MWICASKKGLRQSLFITFALFTAIALAFYVIQNAGSLPGGNIALPKLFWLALVIYCWFIIPVLIAIDETLFLARKCVMIFLCSMFLRAIIELMMMYWFHNWHPYYGIGHDIFSLFLSLGLAYCLWTTINYIAVYFVMMSLLFSVETYFAWYMLNNVQNDSGAVYYVPDGESHQLVLRVTMLVVGITVFYLGFFIRKWLYAASLKS